MSTPDEIKSLVVEAMFNSINQQKRDELVKLALQGLMKEEYTGYGGREKPPLQRLFEREVEEVARQEVKAHLQGDTLEAVEVRKAIRLLTQKAIDKVVDSAELVDHIAKAVTEALTRSRS